MSPSVSKPVSKPRRPRRGRATSPTKAPARRRKTTTASPPVSTTPSAEFIPVPHLAKQLHVTADQIWADIRAGRRLAKDVAGVICVKASPPASDNQANAATPDPHPSAAKSTAKIIGASAHCADTPLPTPLPNRPPTPTSAADLSPLSESLRQQRQQLHSIQDQLTSLAELNSLQELPTLFTQTYSDIKDQLHQLTTTLTELTTATTKLEHTLTTAHQDTRSAITELSATVQTHITTQKAEQSTQENTTATELAKCQQLIVSQNQRIEDLEVLNKALLDNHEL